MIVEDQITFIIPCYNESPKILQETVNNLKDSLKKSGWTHEIIIVDDGSTKQKYNQIQDAKIIRHKKNKGYGAGLKTGILNSKYSWIGITDADGTYPNHLAHKLLIEANHVDMVIGQRDKKGVPFVRRFPKWVLRKIASFLANQTIHDLNSGLRIFKKDVAMKFWNLYPEGFSFTSTITMSCFCNGYDVKYVKIPYYKRKGKSYIHPIKDTLRFLNLLLKLTLYFNPLRFFITLSMILLILAILRGLRDYLLGNHLGGLSLVLFFMSFQVFFFGLIAEIINKKR